MGVFLEDNFRSIQIFRANPSEIKMDESVRIEDPHIIANIINALNNKEIEEADEPFDDFEVPRYILVLGSEKARSVFEVTNSYIISKDKCYYSPSGSVWKELEQIPGEYLKPVIGPDKPCI